MSLSKSKSIWWSRENQYMQALYVGGKYVQHKDTVEGKEVISTHPEGGRFLGAGPFTDFEVRSLHECPTSDCQTDGGESAEDGESTTPLMTHGEDCAVLFLDSQEIVKLTLPDGTRTGWMAGKMFEDVPPTR